MRVITKSHKVKPLKANMSVGIRTTVKDKYGNIKSVSDWDEHGAGLKLQIRVRDPRTNKVIEQGKWRNCNSFVVQFLEIYFPQFTGSSSYTVTKVDGDEDVWQAVSYMRDNAGANSDQWGIVVGTGTNAEANTDYALQTQIEDGSSAGELLYSSQGHTIPAVVGSNVDFVLTRTFTNNSSSTVTIQEAAIYVGETNPTYYRMIIRDLITVAIPNTEARVVEFRFRTTAPGFVIQFLEWLYLNMSQDTLTKITDITNQEYSEEDAVPRCNAPAGNDDYGIIIGTGTTTPTNTDYVIETRIISGVGSGELQYGSQQFTQPTIIGSNVDFILSRSFTNGSGSTVTITEITLNVIPIAAATYFCLIHVLKTVAVADTDTSTIEMRLRTTV